MLDRQPRRGARQIELDDFGRARSDEEQQFDVGPPREQPIDHAVEFLVAIGHAGEVALLDDRGAEARLGEHHHPGGRLQQMRAGARSDDEEERVLYLAVQPDDPGQPAEHFALPAFAQDRASARFVQHPALIRGRCAPQRRGGERRGHPATAITGGLAPCSRAARSLSMNCVALIA